MINKAELMPLAPNWRRIAEVGVGDDAPKHPELGNGEYRTVMAQQRTFLAFIRTALAVTAAFKASPAGVALGCIVLAIGAFQYMWILPLFLYNRSGKVDAHTLYHRARFDAVIIFTAMVAIGVAAVVYRWNDANNDSIENMEVGAVDGFIP